MNEREQNIIKNIIHILAKEEQITVDEQIRMLEMLKRGVSDESTN